MATLIVETVVTTTNPDGSVNCGAMGVEWSEASIVIKPYRGTRTLRNLRATGAAVVNLTEELRDPVDLLFGVQLGGGTDINLALSYCQQLITRPADTILVLVTDLYEGVAWPKW